ncbi:hypothetical protein SODALDRAFT_138987 [Sodiomyces alkalinus F11]|uniref:Uncharacterized protein n=1 Tax=Sodiomyces alkalinus (strain CBS 110278 / VKM F-3762 / F11) TaxID=1314773 RepID=A0A3N2PZ77_SODAK|nr:hypothetical protein SODALDRAFT_138987 [Sodiomyces alkalinus F11]ROT39831.1 hypothetical protein SODALDRAFT_138987 [Sodiomyces alkalinus F11]
MMLTTLRRGGPWHGVLDAVKTVWASLVFRGCFGGVSSVQAQTREKRNARFFFLLQVQDEWNGKLVVAALSNISMPRRDRPVAA